jgi:hypothetical protein
VNPAANIRIAADGAGRLFLAMNGHTPVTYAPDVTITAPSDAIAREFEVGFIQNLLASDRVANYTTGATVRTDVPTVPIKDGAPMASGVYHTIFVQTAAPAILEDFTANNATAHMVFPDVPGDAMAINLLDNAACVGVPAATMVDMTMHDQFRTWLAVRHRPSGCVRALHHIDWDLLWSATVNTAGAIPTRAITSNVINATVANGDGTPPFIQGGAVPADIAHKVCA